MQLSNIHLFLALGLATVSAQSPGNGISKSTYSCNDPIAAKQWLYKYFPVGTPGDECDNDTCICPASGNIPTWDIQQGRVYALQSSSASASNSGRRLLQSPGNGFGLHCVNVSNHITPGGLSTAEVEAHFNKKLGDMSIYDSFMDFNVMFYTSDLAGYDAALSAGGETTHSTAWEYNGNSWTSLFVQVPNTQMILELCQDTTLNAARRTSTTPSSIPRASARVLDLLAETRQSQGRRSSSESNIITPLAVNRAVSAKAWAKLEDFYVTGMGTTMVEDATSEAVSRKCFLWSGAEVDVCFYLRDDSATAGDFKVGDFEDMLNTVHQNVLGQSATCGIDKWVDNHYAIDSMAADTSSIVPYIEENSVLHYCEESQWGGSSLHYAFDPTGWGIQLDMQFSSTPSDCSSRRAATSPVLSSSRKALNTFNPACIASSSCSAVTPAPAPDSPTPSSPTPSTPTPTSPTPRPRPSPAPAPISPNGDDPATFFFEEKLMGIDIYIWLAALLLIALVAVAACCWRRRQVAQERQHALLDQQHGGKLLESPRGDCKDELGPQLQV